MKLLTKEIKKHIPKLYANDKVEDPLAVVKFFTPDSNWTWYVLEGEEQENGDWYFYGYVIGFENELGYFSLNELLKVRGGLGLGVERDLHYEPEPLSVIKQRGY
jgi:hypothetical protein